MNANLIRSTIEMTKNEAAAAGKLNSEKFNELKALREMYPNFKIVITKSKQKSESFKGLTMEYMKKYIKDHKEELLTDFYTLCGLDENGKETEFAGRASYGEIKMWFLKAFPAVKDYRAEIDRILGKAA